MPPEPTATGLLPTEALVPDWPAPPGVRAMMSTRAGGVSLAPFDALNLRPVGLGDDAQDDPAAVTENQRRFAEIGRAHV
jgi:copper oxidase (laccase) domain-containing protein